VTREEDIVILVDQDDGLVAVVGGAVHVGGESLVLDSHTEPLGDLHEWRRGFGLLDGKVLFVGLR
jgi:hypothetical protein